MIGLGAIIDYSAAGLYEYFGSKEEIVAAVCDEGQRYLFNAMSAADPSLPPVDYTYQIGLAYIHFALEHPDCFLLMFTVAPPPNIAEVPETVVIAAMSAEGSAYGILVQAIQRGIADGVFLVRPGFGLDEMAYAAWALVYGVALQDTLQAAGWSVTPWTLRDEKIAYCLGCFKCWTKTPGLCRLDDTGREVVESIIGGHLAIYLTPITFGGYSSELKKAVDRSIGLISPFCTRIDGEVHHHARYDRYPSLVGVGVLPAPHPAQEQIFRTLVGRNATTCSS